jgi:two-component system CheB/CheR fusion protein
MCLPLRARGRTLGVVSFGATSARPAYRSADLRLAEEVTSRAALALDNSRLYESLVLGDRAKDEFLAMLGHELRNPLAPMVHSLEILRIAGADSETRERARRVLDRQVTHMGHLVRDLLDVARISRGTIELRREAVPLASAVANAVETSQAILRAHRHRLTVELPHEPLWLDADPTRLEQILTNLINNAVEYSSPESSTELTARRTSDEVEIRIRDHGTGIAPGLLPDIFELFARGERSGQGEGPGMGVGLYLVKRLVELHGGQVRAFSEGPLRGSEFVLQLPLALAGPSENGGRADQTSQRIRILVVDDHMDSAEALTELLSMWGHDARATSDGAEALELASQLRPDLVLLDLAMPGMDGFQIARELRRRPETRRAVLVALTGFADVRARARSREAGFDHHFPKPIQAPALREFLASLASRRASSEITASTESR